MKRVKTFITLLLLAISLQAQQDGAQIVIEKQDNTSRTIAFDALQKITFNSTDVNILLKDGTVISNDMSNIQRIISYTQSTNIESAMQGSEKLVNYLSADIIAVNCTAGSTIAIYSINGSHIYTTKLKTDFETISIAALPKGIYLLKADERTAKIIKR